MPFEFFIDILEYRTNKQIEQKITIANCLKYARDTRV